MKLLWMASDFAIFALEGGKNRLHGPRHPQSLASFPGLAKARWHCCRGCCVYATWRHEIPRFLRGIRRNCGIWRRSLFRTSRRYQPAAGDSRRHTRPTRSFPQ
jgi:hypothetical protein